MRMFPIAVIADVHGNSLALTAVLDEIRRRRISRIINLGDSLYGPLDPLATFAIFTAENNDQRMFHIQGNGDRMLLEADSTLNMTARANKRLFNEKHNVWLRELPSVYEDGKIWACHGSPGDDAEYLCESMGERGGILRPVDDIAALVEGISQPVILCAHSHIPRVVRLSDGRLIVNPGSVGLPAYEDDTPVKHRMETGSPYACFAIISEYDDGYMVEQKHVPYDHDAAARLAARNGREDWAYALQTGRACLS